MAGAMSLFLYLAVLCVSVTSVLLGLDWLASPPPPPGKPPVQVVRAPAPVAAPAPAVTPVTVDAKVAAPSPSTTPAAPAAAAGAVEPAATTGGNAPLTTTDASAKKNGPADAMAGASAGTPDAAATSVAPPGVIAGPDENAFPQADATLAPRCDVRACETAYVSFRASDCTWQPYDGPRRFCDKGTPPPAASMAGTTAQAQAPAATCNIQACARAYYSFNPADCTWQPYEGPRQLCEK